jgi:hypothetical protein
MQPDISTQLGAAALLSFALSWLKQSRLFPWISNETDKLNRVLMIVGAGLAAVGITVRCDWASHSCMVSGLDYHTMANGVWVWFQQVAITHGWYRTTKPR